MIWILFFRFQWPSQNIWTLCTFWNLFIDVSRMTYSFSIGTLSVLPSYPCCVREKLCKLNIDEKFCSTIFCTYFQNILNVWKKIVTASEQFSNYANWIFDKGRWKVLQYILNGVPNGAISIAQWGLLSNGCKVTPIGQWRKILVIVMGFVDTFGQCVGLCLIILPKNKSWFNSEDVMWTLPIIYIIWTKNVANKPYEDHPRNYFILRDLTFRYYRNINIK